MILVDVWVPGAAKTKGSMEVRNRATGAMKESVIGSSAWRVLMAQAVRDDIARRQPPVAELRSPWPGAVTVTMVAYLAPAITARPAGWLWPVWDKAGDVDKLARNVLDALGSRSKNAKMNGGAIADDNLVCKLIAEKNVADSAGVQPAGVRIIVETL